MQGLPFLFILTLCWQATFGQKQLPTIKATSALVDIRVGNEYFAKGGWTLDPKKKPDIFSIGSKWPYDFKKVTFTTDVDSISLNVQPDHAYDFIIVLNQQTPCYIQISTLANPVFMTAKIVGAILAGFAVLLTLAYLLKRRITPIYLLYAGYAVPLLFWLAVFISGHLHGNYNHLKNVISELGAIGTKSEVFTSASFVFIAYLSTLFSIGFYRASSSLKLPVVPATLSFSIPISMTWAAIFPLGNELHSLLGPFPFLVIVGSLAAFLFWRKEIDFSALRHVSLFCFFIMLLILMRLIKPFGFEYEGLVQRFFYIGWTIWTLAVTYSLSNKLKENKRDPHDEQITAVLQR